MQFPLHLPCTCIGLRINYAIWSPRRPNRTWMNIPCSLWSSNGDKNIKDRANRTSGRQLSNNERCLCYGPSGAANALTLLVKVGIFRWHSLLQGTLHDQQAQPFSKLPTCIGQQPDLPESERRMQGDRGNIHSTDAGNHRVAAFCPTFCDQSRQQHLADTVTDAVRTDIN